jgi:adenosylcobinamide-phosphate synthase
MVWSVVVLYATLGFRQFSHHFTAIRDALEAGDEMRARQLLALWQRVDASELPRSEIVRHVIEYSVLAAHRHVFGVLAWFSVLAAFGFGPAGAVLYRMSEFVTRYWRYRNRIAGAAGQRGLQSAATAPGRPSTGCRRASRPSPSPWSAASRRRSTAGATTRSASPTTTTA